MNIIRNIGAGLLSAIFLLMASKQASADPASDCRDAFATGQKDVLTGRFLEARRELEACAVATCGTNLPKDCRTDLEALLPRIPTVLAVATDGDKPMSGFTLTLDGQPVATEGKAIEVNPGSHTFVFTAKDGRTKTVVLTILESKPGQEVSVVFDKLAALPATTNTAPSSDVGAVAPRPETETTSDSTIKWIGIAGLGAGVVITGVGGIVALSAKSKYDDARQAHCPSGICDPDGRSLTDDARSKAGTATVVMGLGAALAVAGAIVWLTAPASESATGVTTVGIGAHGLSIGGRF